MKKVEYYIAEDGKRFDNEEDCLYYELFDCKRKKIGNNLIMLDRNREKVDKFDDAWYVIVRTKEATKFLEELCEYEGFYTPWSANSNLSGTGVFKFNDYNDVWEDFEEKVIELNKIYEDIKFLVGNEGFETLYEA